MSGIEIFGSVEKGQNFITSMKDKKFLFSFVISYTETSEIPGITFAGSDPNKIKFTPPADAEFLYYGHCKCINEIPMTPDGKPTPALLTKVALEFASIPHIVINAGSKISPDLPFIQTKLEPGKNIAKETALDISLVGHAVDFGRIVGRTLASVTDCLIIGESLPGGTTTALAVMRAFNIDAKVSSSIPKNPIELKHSIVNDALKRLSTKDPFSIISEVGDPIIPFIAGMISSASEVSNVLLAGGTQMLAILAFANSVGFNSERVVIGTTSYITNDKTANFLEIIKKISDIPVIVVDPKLENSKIDGIKAFSDGFAKEGVGAGGSIIASMIRTGLNSEKFLELLENEYKRIFT